jgi:hypothetical protein
MICVPAYPSLNRYGLLHPGQDTPIAMIHVPQEVGHWQLPCAEAMVRLYRSVSLEKGTWTMHLFSTAHLPAPGWPGPE